ncbi:MAG TPA: hypothetical protein DCE42_04200 [Myxococcales bacterium]|nr:hypothetical protein [Deltaproteobacteria bacterium]MBU47685.1 hypothetical protein [Deltaproteobacteria bacterium]HAA53928.1 hypothetical protein [Myxococcales bacterium]|tara:strand:- start:23043 stop:23738 length:696 start_codon:yes stop_codon:yes gene_type:complete
MHVRDIIDELKEQVITLEAALHKGIPEELLHLFACDCAERALRRQESHSRTTDERSWEAIHTKRLWVHDKAPDTERSTALGAAKEAVLLADDRTLYAKRRAGLNSAYRAVWFTERASQAAAESAFKSCIKDARRAALHASSFALETAARSVYGGKDQSEHNEALERHWQIKRLCWYLSLITFAGHRWLTIAPGGLTPAAEDTDCQLDTDLPRHSPHDHPSRSSQTLQAIAS